MRLSIYCMSLLAGHRRPQNNFFCFDVSVSINGPRQKKLYDTIVLLSNLVMRPVMKAVVRVAELVAAISAINGSLSVCENTATFRRDKAQKRPKKSLTASPGEGLR